MMKLFKTVAFSVVDHDGADGDEEVYSNNCATSMRMVAELALAYHMPPQLFMLTRVLSTGR